LSADYVQSHEHALRALTIASPVERSYGLAIGAGVASAQYLNKSEDLGLLLPRLLAIEPSVESIEPVALAIYAVVVTLLIAVRHDAAAPFRHRMQELADAWRERDPLAMAWASYASAFWARDVEQDAFQALSHMRETVTSFEVTGARQFLAISMVQTALACM